MNKNEVQAARDEVEYEMVAHPENDAMPKVDALIAAVHRKGLNVMTQCHPEADGRTPIEGEYKWHFKFTLVNGDILKISMGREAHDDFRAFILSEEMDDAIDAAEGNPT